MKINAEGIKNVCNFGASVSVKYVIIVKAIKPRAKRPKRYNYQKQKQRLFMPSYFAQAAFRESEEFRVKTCFT